MSPRSIRRAAERKARKQARKAEKRLAVAAPPAIAEPLTLEEEFTPEFLAEARAMRERVERRVALMKQSTTRPLSSRAAINRANSLHSTGPVTPEGKLACTENIVDQSVGLAEAR